MLKVPVRASAWVGVVRGLRDLWSMLTGLGDSPGANRTRRLWIEWFATGVFATILVSTLVLTTTTSRLDNTIYDLSLRLQEHRPRSDIVIVGIDPESLASESSNWPWPRTELAVLIAAIARQRPAALGCHFWYFSKTTPAADQALHDAMAMTRTYLAVPLDDPAIAASGRTLRPLPIFKSASKGSGLADAEPDPDGIVRRASLFQGAGGQRVGRLVLQMARQEGRGPDITNSGINQEKMLIPFVGKQNRFTYVSAYRLMHGDSQGISLTGKFVLFGATSHELLDNYPTPMSAGEGMPNVEIDANILDAILSGRTLTAAPPVAVILISATLLWLMLVALVRLGPKESLWVAAGMSGLPLAGAILAVPGLGLWVPPVAYLVTLAIIVPYWGWRRLNAASGYFAEELRALERDAGAGIVAQTRLAARVGGDVVLQQMTLLEVTRRRIFDLRRFVADILANFPDPVLVVDRDGLIITVNQMALRFAAHIGVSAAPGAPVQPIVAGLEATGGVGTPAWPPPEPSEASASEPAAALLTGDGPGGRTYELRYTATRGAQDDFTGWIVHLADITSLMAAINQREEAMQLLSHDMRSPLSAIIAVLNLPEFRDAPAIMRQKIERQALRTLEMADAFVRLAKAETAEYKLEDVDLTFVLQNAVDSTWSLAQERGVTISYRPDLDVEYLVLADSGLVTRALVNLLDNAVKFSSRGQVVRCDLAPATLDGRPAVTCRIADDAGGMRPTQLAGLFRKFAGGRDASNASPSVGLGLALVQTVVARHEGKIACDSRPGEGTTFTVTLPLYQEAAAPVAVLAAI